MKRFLFLFMIAFTGLQLYGKRIDESTAKSVADSFFSSFSGTQPDRSGSDMVLSYRVIADKTNVLTISSEADTTLTTYFY